MTAPARINVAQMSADEFARLLASYEELVEVMRLSNNRLIEKLVNTDGFTNDHGMILNDWSLFHRHLSEQHALHLERMVATVN